MNGVKVANSSKGGYLGMNKHLTNDELKQFADGEYSVKKLVAISQHLSQCENCKNSLKKISPDFFADLGANQEVHNEKHFSNDEITSFLRAELPIKYRLQMSDHLRNCIACKTKLYQTNPHFLKQTISNYLNKEEPVEKKSYSASLNALIPIGAMAILLIGVISYLLFISFKNNGAVLQTKVEETPVKTQTIALDNSSKINTEKSSANVAPTPKTLESNGDLTSNKINEEISKSKNINIAKVKPLEKDNVKSNTAKVTISNSRSANSQSDCENQVTIVTPYFEKITESQPIFRWKSVPNAVKYNLYVSDTAQILIEEAETKENSYKLKASLEPNKQYKWKVIATMPDSKTLNSPSIEFSLGKTPQKYRFTKNRNKTINDVRCLKK